MDAKIKILFIIACLTASEPSSLECQGTYRENCFIGPNSADDYQTFDNAILWCLQRSSQLAVINDSETQDAVSEFLDSWSNYSTRLVYINMKLLMATQQTWYLINGSVFYGDIADQNTDLYNLYMSLQFFQNTQSLPWQNLASRPDVLRQYICEFNGSYCPATNNSFIYNGRCFVKYENDSVNWFEARKRCISEGGDLATFNNPRRPGGGWNPTSPFDTSKWDQSLSYWIGIRYDNLSWMSPADSQNESMFYNWSNGKPNNYSYSCVCLDPNAVPRWSWTDCNCSVPRPFLCLANIQKTTSITITTAQLTVNGDRTDNMKNRIIIGVVVGVGGALLILVVVIIVVLCIIKRRKGERKRASDAAVAIRGNHSQSSVTTSGDHRHTLQPPSSSEYEGLKSEQGGTEAHAYDRLNQLGTLEYEEIAGTVQR